MVKVPAPRSRQKCPQSAVALATVSWCANAGGIATEVNPSIIPKTAKCFIRWFFSFSLLLLATIVQTSENTSELSRFTELGTSSIGGEKYVSSGESVGDGERQRAVAVRNRRNFLQVESKDLC